MYTKTIEYVDYNGNPRKEKFYFNLNKAEISEKELGSKESYTDMLTRIIETDDKPAIFSAFKTFILDSYGEKSPDGKRFIKIAPDGHRLSDDFSQTEAFSELFVLLGSDTDEAIKFVNGIMPGDNVVSFEDAKNAVDKILSDDNGSNNESE